MNFILSFCSKFLTFNVKTKLVKKAEIILLNEACNCSVNEVAELTTIINFVS